MRFFNVQVGKKCCPQLPHRRHLDWQMPTWIKRTVCCSFLLPKLVVTYFVCKEDLLLCNYTNNLRKPDTRKTCSWNFFKFSWDVRYGKICKKSGLKTGCHHANFWVLEVKRSKKLQKLNKRDCFCLWSWFHFLWRFSSRNWFRQ